MPKPAPVWSQFSRARTRAAWAALLALLLAACASVPRGEVPTLAPAITPTVSPPPATTLPIALEAPPIPAATTASAGTTPATLVPASPATVEATASPPPTIRLLFTGDINPGRCPAQRALRAGDFTLPYHRVAERLRAADLTIGSLDGSISDLSAPSPCPQTMNLIGPARTVEGLVYAGFDVITVATNHAKDCGARGWNCDDGAFRDTLRHLGAAGLRPVGGGQTLAEALEPVIVEVQGVRFAFIGVTSVGMETWARDGRPGTAPLSDAALPHVAAAIGAARAEADVVIVLAQWGVEYAALPAADQWRWAPLLVGAGADLVIGNHPHVVEPVEVFPARDGVRGGVVAYALGNFVFDQGPWETRQGVVFEAVFTGASLASWQLLPIHIYSLHQPDWAVGEEAEAILQRAQAALPER